MPQSSHNSDTPSIIFIDPNYIGNVAASIQLITSLSPYSYNISKKILPTCLFGTKHLLDFSNYPFLHVYLDYVFIWHTREYPIWKLLNPKDHSSFLQRMCTYRYRGEDDDRMSIASRKMTAYAKTDCIGASKGLFFGLITLVLGVISLILFFVLIDNDNKQVSFTFSYFQVG